MVEDAQTHLLPAQAAELDNVAQLHGLADGGELLAALEPLVERAGEIFDGLAPDHERKLSGDPDTLVAQLAEFGFRRPCGGGAAHIRLAFGQGALAALAGGARGV